MVLMELSLFHCVPPRGHCRVHQRLGPGVPPKDHHRRGTHGVLLMEMVGEWEAGRVEGWEVGGGEGGDGGTVIF